jgi:proline dehydrogenase
MHIFDNTEIAFKIRSTRELKKASVLFKLMSNPVFVKISGKLTGIGIRMGLLPGWLVKQTVYNHFCGGETLEECREVIRNLERFKVQSVPDFAAENIVSDENREMVISEIIRTMEFASKNPAVPFSVFKPTALASAGVLSKASSFAPSRIKECPEVEKFSDNFKVLCQAAYERGVRVMIDAEESHYQPIIDKLAAEMMELYNQEKATVFNTVQMYRHDRLDFLKECFRESSRRNYHLGIKLVRGAYMEQERKRALEMGYPSPIYPDKESTDAAFDQAIDLCLQNLDRTSLFVGTHNEKSLLLLMDRMRSGKLARNDHRIYVSQLYGMSDHISFNMACRSYNVAKYLPYGPVRYLLPYLLRRLEENKSVSGQAGRELRLLKLELNRRKNTNPKKDDIKQSKAGC